jgi:hypothetical protein
VLTLLAGLKISRLAGWVDLHTHPLSYLGFGRKAVHEDTAAHTVRHEHFMASAEYFARMWARVESRAAR